MHMCMRSTMYNSMVIPIAQCLNCCHHRRWCAGSVGWRASLLPLCASCTWRDSAACTHECRWSSPGTQICHILYGSRWSGRQDGGFVWIRGRFPLGFVAVFQILRILGRVFSRLANIFVLLAQGLERGSYEPDVTGSIPVWDMAEGLFSPFFQFFLAFSPFSFSFLSSFFFAFLYLRSHDAPSQRTCTVRH